MLQNGGEAHEIVGEAEGGQTLAVYGVEAATHEASISYIIPLGV